MSERLGRCPLCNRTLTLTDESAQPTPDPWVMVPPRPTDWEPAGTCLRCGIDYVREEGRLKIRSCPGFPTLARLRQRQASPATSQRDPITLSVRETLHAYVEGKRMPRERLRFLVGMLIDMHCQLEGAIVAPWKKKLAPAGDTP